MSKTTIQEAARKTTIISEVDVLVVGGGPAGVSAAVAAARAGAKTCIVESYGFFGGMWTAGLVLTLAGYNCWLEPYERCVDGIAGEWLRRATARGFAEDNDGWVVNSEPEGMKLIADEMILEAGVEVLFHTLAVDTIVEDNSVAGVIVENRDGRGAILADVVIDCTGNGDIMARSGAAYVKAEHMQPLTLAFDIGNIVADPAISHTESRRLPLGPEPAELIGAALRKNASRRLDIHFDYEKFNADYAKGKLPLFGGPWTGGLWKDVAWMNTVRVVGDGSDARDFTRAELEGRKNAFQLAEYFYKHVPGFENGRIQRLATEIGVRETRRLVGEYTLTGNDVRATKPFSDVIGLGCWSIDIHPRDAKANHSLFAPLPFDLPYKMLVPKSIDGLLVAGRCVSSDQEALASIRAGATCAVTGHAAGAAAALASRNNIQPRHIDVEELQGLLREQNALLTL